MALTPGTMVGPYRIVEQLGKGGMATVYKAHQAALARYVAIKVLPEFLAEEPGFAERFQQEAVAVAKLRHPNILAVFDYGSQDNVAYIVNEFIDGGTLGDQVGKPLPVEYVAEVLRPVASALDYAHARGILHRDIKPSNILLSHDGTPVLADFGLAKMLERGGPALTQSGMIVGTPEYMAPEQCSGEQVGPPADIYSLAVVAYEMLTGRPPFMAATPAAVIMAQLHNELPPPRSVNPGISSEVEAVLLKGLAREPGSRYRKGGDMVKALAEASEAGPAGEPAAVAEHAAPAPLTPPPTPTPPPSQPAAQPPTPAPFAPPTPVSQYAPPSQPSPQPYTQGQYAASQPYGQQPYSQPFGYNQQAAWPQASSSAQAAPSRTPTWITVLLIVGAVLVVLMDILFLVTGITDASNRDGDILIVIWETFMLLAIIVTTVIAIYRPGLARLMVTIGSIAVFLGTCFGIPLTILVLWGIWRNPSPVATPYRRA